jgi:hypothetical protein
MWNSYVHILHSVVANVYSCGESALRFKNNFYKLYCDIMLCIKLREILYRVKLSDFVLFNVLFYVAYPQI